MDNYKNNNCHAVQKTAISIYKLKREYVSPIIWSFYKIMDNVT